MNAQSNFLDGGTYFSTTDQPAKGHVIHLIAKNTRSSLERYFVLESMLAKMPLSWIAL